MFDLCLVHSTAGGTSSITSSSTKPSDEECMLTHWVAEKKERQLKHKELDLALLFSIKFYGKDYEVDSLRTMLAALDTVLREIKQEAF